VFAKSTKLWSLREVSPLIFYVKNVPIWPLSFIIIIFFIVPCGNQARGELFFYSFHVHILFCPCGKPYSLYVSTCTFFFFFFLQFIFGASIVMRLAVRHDMYFFFFFFSLSLMKWCILFIFHLPSKTHLQLFNGS
jgi:hypothetical protein